MYKYTIKSPYFYLPISPVIFNFKSLILSLSRMWVGFSFLLAASFSLSLLNSKSQFSRDCNSVLNRFIFCVLCLSYFCKTNIFLAYYSLLWKFCYVSIGYLSYYLDDYFKILSTSRVYYLVVFSYYLFLLALISFSQGYYYITSKSSSYLFYSFPSDYDSWCISYSSSILKGFDGCLSRIGNYYNCLLISYAYCFHLDLLESASVNLLYFLMLKEELVFFALAIFYLSFFYTVFSFFSTLLYLVLDF